jgi:nicotinamidase-related amidase
LVVIDAQRAIDDPRWGRRNNPGAEAVIGMLLGRRRSKGWPVVHVHHLPSDPDSTFQGPGGEVKPEAAVLDGQSLVHKHTPDAFRQTGLESLLRARAFETLVLVGFITENSVEASARSAGNLGFKVIVVPDGCATFDKTDRTGRLWRAQDIHDLSLANLDGEYARVLDLDQVLSGF